MSFSWLIWDLDDISERTFKIKTTIANQGVEYPPDLLKGQFKPGQLNLVWSLDLTYLGKVEGFCYLCGMREKHSHRVLGQVVAPRMGAGIVLEALRSAITTRGGHHEGVFLHTDRGKQFVDQRVVKLCDTAGIRRSMGATGSCYDHASIESFWSIFTHEYFFSHGFANLEE